MLYLTGSTGVTGFLIYVFGHKETQEAQKIEEGAKGQSNGGAEA